MDDEGEESTTEIKIIDSVELLFYLLGPQLDRLLTLENDSKLVLSLGGAEAIATIGLGYRAYSKLYFGFL
jgi:hypothetical protein